MHDTPRVLAVLVIGAAITLGLRTIPFALIAPLRQSSVVQRLSVTMPGGILVILAVYLLRDVDVSSLGAGAPAVACLLLAAGLWWWRGSVSLAVLASTATYMTLINLLL